MALDTSYQLLSLSSLISLSSIIHYPLSINLYPLSIIHYPLFILFIVGGLEPNPADMLPQAGCTLDWSPVCLRADKLFSYHTDVSSS